MLDTGTSQLYYSLETLHCPQNQLFLSITNPISNLGFKLNQLS